MILAQQGGSLIIANKILKSFCRLCRRKFPVKKRNCKNRSRFFLKSKSPWTWGEIRSWSGSSEVTTWCLWLIKIDAWCSTWWSESKKVLIHCPIRARRYLKSTIFRLDFLMSWSLRVTSEWTKDEILWMTISEGTRRASLLILHQRYSWKSDFTLGSQTSR